MVVFSILLMLVIIFRQQGLMGRNEFSWDMLVNVKPPEFLRKFFARFGGIRPKGGTKAGRAG
jgi:hypothetical protein